MASFQNTTREDARMHRMKHRVEAALESVNCSRRLTQWEVQMMNLDPNRVWYVDTRKRIYMARSF